MPCRTSPIGPSVSGPPPNPVALPLSRPAVELETTHRHVYVANDSGGLAVVDFAPEAEGPKLLTPDPGP